MLADIFAQALQKKGDDDLGPKTTAKMAAAGRDGDSLIAHINPREAAILKAIGGRGSVNPKTGALEFAFDDGGALGGGGIDWGQFGNQANDLSSALGGADWGNPDTYSNPNGSDSGGTGMGSGLGFLNGQGYTNNGVGLSQEALDAANFSNQNLGPTLDQFNRDFGNGSDASAYGTPEGISAASPTADQYLDPSAMPAGTDATAGSAPASAGAQAPGGTPAAGAINPEAAIGYNPLSAWQASFGSLGAGQQPALSRLDSGEVVYGEDQPSLGNLRGMRDNTNFAVDGFQRSPNDDLSIANVGAGGLGGEGGERPDESGSTISTWSGVGPAGFGIQGGASRGQAAGSVENPAATNMGSNPLDAYGSRVPTITPNYRDTSSFSTPMADAISRIYDQNPDMPSGYPEGMYGIESSYGANMHRPGSQFAGPYQFSKSTMASAAPQLAPVTNNTLYDPYANMQALSGEFANMKAALGRNPTAEEAYTMHQQGVRGGAMAISNPYTPMTELGRPARSITANGLPADATYRDFIQKFGTPFGFQADYSPDGSIQGPEGLGSMFR